MPRVCIDVRFNPCYVGLWSVSLIALAVDLIFLEFQSLLCWIMVCKSRDHNRNISITISFNPCYVGLWSVSGYCGGIAALTIGFNPCYVGLWSVRNPPAVDWPACSSFNPCYVGLWSVSSPPCPIWGVAFYRFNPCYVGLWSVSRMFSAYLADEIAFQSLLCWIMVCKRCLP